jgi:LCP family protein required for cell wall assembly
MVLFLASKTTARIFTPEKRINFIIFGVDEEEARTDTMMLGCLNTEEKKLDLISIPRDTQVVMPENRRAVLEENGRWAPADGVMKLNQVYFYGGEEYGAEYAMKQITELTGVEIKYYAIVNLEAFRYIVDEVGGVNFDVPFRLWYHDPFQNLSIELEPGFQKLNGQQAEGLVRFRKSDDGALAYYTDWDRAQTQQKFLKELITQTMRDNNKVKNASVFVSAAIKYVETNCTAADALKYLPYIQDLAEDGAIRTHSMSGWDELKNGQWYTFLDMDELALQVDGIFNSDKAKESAIGLDIYVLNGGSVSGLAARNRLFLESKGFTVSRVGDYDGERKNYTRIIVKSREYGSDIQALYPGSKIEVDASAYPDDDIALILGTNEQ